MKFAVISDVHGNYPALKAVMEDVKARGITKYIIAGDYCLSGPYPDECITALRSIEDKYIIRGNEEAYLENLVGKDQSGWTDGQMQISYWCYRNISKENLEYLCSLPHTIDFDFSGVDLHIAHHYRPFLGELSLPNWMPSSLAARYAGVDLTADMLREDIQADLDENEEFSQVLSQLDDGVYIFGHTHVQWTYKAKDREVYMLNPGSCGLPLDGIRNSVPYAVIDISEDGAVAIEQIRLPFDKAAYINELKTTSQFTDANVWSKVIIHELDTAKEHLTFFLRFADKYANDIGDLRRPFSVETWEKAYELWNGRIAQGIFD